MSLKLITPPTTYPVTVAEVKAHARVDTSADDTLIAAMISAATTVAEQETGRAIMTQTWLLTLDEFPDEIELTRVPVQSIVSVTYTDPTGADLPLNTGSNWRLLDLGDFAFARIVPVFRYEWPETRAQNNVVAVQYVAGYANAAAVPTSIKQWVLMRVASMYDNRADHDTARDAAATRLPWVDSLLDPYRVWNL